MGEVKWIRIEITPSYLSTQTQKISQCKIIVKTFGNPEFLIEDYIPDSDFQSRFEWFMERATKIVKEKLYDHTH